MALIVLRLVLPVLLLDVKRCVSAKREKKNIAYDIYPKKKEILRIVANSTKKISRGERKKEREIQHVKPQRAATVRTKRNCLIV